jgi:ABC-2 type transport system ATP-binding protein
VLLSSRMLAEAAQTVDNVAIVDRGRLVGGGPVDDVATDWRTLEDVYLELTGATS